MIDIPSSHLTQIIIGIIIGVITLTKRGDIMQTQHYLSSTNLAKNTAATLSSIETGDSDKIIILKNNTPKAILMSIEAYEAMEEEIEDLRLTALALSRIQSFNPVESISHEEMMKKYAK